MWSVFCHRQCHHRSKPIETKTEPFASQHRTVYSKEVLWWPAAGETSPKNGLHQPRRAPYAIARGGSSRHGNIVITELVLSHVCGVQYLVAGFDGLQKGAVEYTIVEKDADAHID